MAQSAVNCMAGDVVRTWRAKEGGRPILIQVQHATVSGGLSVTVDGEPVPGVSSFSCFASSAVVHFSVGDLQGRVHLENKENKCFYACVLDGKDLTEDNQLGAEQETQLMANKDANSPLALSVPSAILGTGTSGRTVVWYEVHSQRLANGKTNAVHRRFSEFLGLADTISACYKGSGVTLPSAPPKGVKLFQNQSDPVFIERRRQELERWLQALERVPRMRYNTFFLQLIGAADSAAMECSVMFCEGPMGLSLRQGDGIVEVIGYRQEEGGAAGQAEASGRIGIGDIISKLNGEPVVGLPHDVLIAKIKAARRPMVLHFIGYGGSSASAEGRAAAALASPEALDAEFGGAAAGGGGSASAAAAAGVARYDASAVGQDDGADEGSAAEAPAPAPVPAPQPEPEPEPMLAAADAPAVLEGADDGLGDIFGEE